MNNQRHNPFRFLLAFCLLMLAGQVSAGCEVARTCSGLPAEWNQVMNKLVALGPTGASSLSCRTSGATKTCPYANGGTQVTTVTAQTATAVSVTQTLTNKPTYQCDSVGGTPNTQQLVAVRNGSGSGVSQLDSGGRVTQTHQTFSATDRLYDGTSYTLSYDMTMDAQGIPLSGSMAINGSSVDVQVLRDCGYFGDLGGSTPQIAPASLTISAPATLQANGRTSLGATVTYNTGVTQSVTPTWSSSNPAVATISSTGVLSAGSVATNTPVTLTATYTENGATVSASKTLTVTVTPATLAGLAIAGGATVSSGGLLRLATTASYVDGSSRTVTATSWSASPVALATISSRGELTAAAVMADTPLTVTASYTQDGVTKTANLAITIKATPATPVSLAIVGGQVSLASGSNLTLAAETGYSDGSRKRVEVDWHVSNTTAASIDDDGKLTAKAVTQDTPVVVTASYGEGGLTATARFSLTIQPIVTPPVLVAEVIATTNTQNLTSFQLWFNTQVMAAMNRAGGQYKVYVAALLPAGLLSPDSMLLMLNRSRAWQGLSWPLPEFLSGVNANDWQLIDVLDAMDTSILSGTVFIVGYGTSDSEMLNAGRYQVVYRVP